MISAFSSLGFSFSRSGSVTRGATMRAVCSVAVFPGKSIFTKFFYTAICGS
jgi:hypothetical protein